MRWATERPPPGELATDERVDMEVKLRVNGRVKSVDVRPTETLLETLRTRLNLVGAREGCGVGMCGACTVRSSPRPSRAACSRLLSRPTAR